MKKLFFDMDNTLAIFSLSREHEKSVVLEKMYEKGFFAGLEPMPHAKQVVQELQVRGYEVFLVSACIESKYVIPEKIQWVQRELPSVSLKNVHLLPIKNSKADLIKGIFGELTSDYVLIDDYHVNLQDWEHKGGKAIQKLRPTDQVKHDYLHVRDLRQLLNMFK